MDPEQFREHKAAVIEVLVARCAPAIACHTEHDDQIFSWICADSDRNTLHFLFTKEWARENGIAKSLLLHMFPWFGDRSIWYTHKSKASRFLQDKWKMQYNPYKVMKCGKSLL
jgi:hypothetical protein